MSIKPRPISGFPEFLPPEQILFAKVLDIIRSVFEHHGFSPIETSSVERKEVLTAKGGIEKEIYALSRFTAEPGEHLETDLALHFDLTVPLARYVAMYQDKLAFPFRRYQIQKVWRAEKAQSGRYREFYQADIDVIGRGTLNLLTDAEIPSVIYQVFREMKVGPFIIRINNRKILQGYFRYLGIPDDRISLVMRLADKLEKMGTSQMTNDLVTQVGINEIIAGKVVDFLGEKLTNQDILSWLERMGKINQLFSEGIKELRIVVDGMRTLGVPEENFRVDLGVARGLDYYTGTVYDTVLTDHLGIGAICSGGRYDDLANYFTNEKFPGVGISIGVTRLVPRLIEAGILKPSVATSAPVLVLCVEENRIREYLDIGATLRMVGISTEVYLEKTRLSDQLRYANKKGFSIAIIAGESEFARKSVKVKNLLTGDETLQSIDELAQKVNELLRGDQ